MFVLEPGASLGLPPGDGSRAPGLRERAAGAYLGLAVGDALGATLEFLTPREIRGRYGEHRDIVGGGWLNLRKGRVTDDTEMSLALGRSILSSGRVDAKAVAEAFSAWMRTKPVDMGNTVRRGIARYRHTGETEVPPNEYDAGNGACMRCLPVALAYLGADDTELAEANRLQSHVTHHSELADCGTLTVIHMVQSALLHGDSARLRGLADGLARTEQRYRYTGRPLENPGGYLAETLVAVFQSLFARDSFESALVDVVNRGGDADTTGAILGMIVGGLDGVGAIPRRWVTALDAEVCAACLDQAARLLAMSPHCRASHPPMG
jgi:ADP-ribosyl-[dinitrogen reductase] hydrolase